MASIIQLRRGTATQWSTANPVLGAGEVGLDTTNKNFRVGDGSTAWSTLTNWITGTVTTVSVASANGFAGTVANATTTPAITLTTTITGLLKGNGTAISAATAGTDYLSPSSTSSALTSFGSNPNFNNPLLTSISTVGGGGNEGGQINFARTTDGAQYWYIDTYGSTSTPDLRVIENTSERFRFVAGGALSVGGSTGTSGQVLTSNGSGSAPTWNTVSGTSSNSFTTIAVPSGTNPAASSSTDTLTLSAGTGISISGSSSTKTVTITSTVTDTNTYPTTWTWTGGTTAGPTASITGSSSTISVAAVPSASSTASGIVNTTTQTFAGNKTFSGFVTLNGGVSTAANTNLSLGAATGTGSYPILFSTSSSPAATTSSGAFEYDQYGFYGTVNNGSGSSGAGRGVIPTQFYYSPNTQVNFTNNTSAQSIFGLATGINLIAGYTYDVEMYVYGTCGTTSGQLQLLCSMNASSGSQYLWVSAFRGSSSTPTALESRLVTSISALSNITSAGTGAVFVIMVRGRIVVTTNTPWLPQLAFSVASGSAPTAIAGSYVKVTPIGNGNQAAPFNLGAWS